MVTGNQLVTKFKQLRLGGMTETLELRLDQCQKQKLGYMEFLEMMLEDEIERRNNKRMTVRLTRAHFEEQKTLEEFDFGFNPEIPSEKIRDLATCQFIERKESVIICGPVGTGKTHLAQALGHRACRQGYSVLYIKTQRLLADLGGGMADGTLEKRLRRYINEDLLILDDFGTKEFSEHQCENLYELVNERYLKGSTIVVSNRAIKDWYQLFANLVLGESILDRIVNSAHHIISKGRSYRPMLRPDNEKKQDSKSQKRFEKSLSKK